MTLSQMEVLGEEIHYQDQVTLAGQLQAQSFMVPTLASVMGAMMGGGNAQSLSDGIKAMTDFAQKLIDEGYKNDVKAQEAQDQALSHPMFAKFRELQMEVLTRDVNVG